MKVLVTGSSGFIGKHLVKRLKDDGYQVVTIDNEDGLGILGDVGDLFKGVETVFHLAALTRPQESIIYPIETNKVNVEGTLRVLLHCRDNFVKRIIFASTTALYGYQEELPTQEIAVPNPISPYAVSKLIGEEYCKLFKRMYGLEFNIIRPFNVYGKGQNPNGTYAAAVPKFIDALKTGKTPQITGDGTQSRDFIYVDDVVDLLIAMAFCKLNGEVFNAGSGVATSINDLYHTISYLMDSGVEPEYIPAVLEPSKTLGDISKADDLLGWKPKVSLEEGLRRIINE